MAARRFTLDFLRTEAAVGAAVALAALLGLIVANSPLAPIYRDALDVPQTLQVGAWSETLPGLDWVKDGLMALVFFAVGLEIKLEGVKGELSSPRRLAFPAAAALGGMVGAAALYALVDRATGGGADAGWPIPTPTDGALALAVLALTARRRASGLRTFLLALSAAQLLGAVLLIAALYTHDIDWGALRLAGAALAAMAALSRWKRAPALAWGLAAAMLWGFSLHSGVNPAVAAVAAAMTIPLRPRKDGERGVLERVIAGLAPYVAFGVLPLFAFCAAGVSFDGMTLRDVAAPATLAVLAGVAIGKPLGVLGAAALAVRLKLARRPTGAGWGELAGVAILSGVGFTFSLYLAGLAFDGDPASDAQARLGVIAGGVICALAGGGVLWALDRRATASTTAPVGTRKRV
ncbi:Na+/H+ antiporter NhaA [soil metagenome]